MTELDKIPVLLVDDRPENLTALEGLLDDLGLDLFKAASGNEALRLSLKHDFAIVLMDVRMPDMDGFETAELMRANPKTSRLPIIFVTAAMKDSEHQFKGYETGAFDYLLKPVEPAILRSKMRVFCDLYRQRRRLELHEEQLEALVSGRTAELNETLNSLRSSEGRFRELLASVTSYMYTVVMDSGRVVSTKHGSGCLAVTGFSAEEYAVDPALWYRMIHSEDRQLVLDVAQEVLTGKSAKTFEHRIRHKNGSIRWVQTTLVPHVGPEGQLLSYDGVIVDISERKQSVETLREREAFIHNMLDSVDEGFIVVDREYRILSANKAFCRFAKTSEARILGQHCYLVSHHKKTPCYEAGEECAVKRTFDTGAAAHASHIHVDEQGAKQYVEIKSYPIIDGSGTVVSAIETFIDVTEKRKLEDQLAQAQKMEAIGTLAGGVAHDFNNILTAIIGYATIVKMKMRPDDSQRGAIDQILASSERATHLTQSLLAFSRKQAISPKPVNLNDIVRSIEKMLRRLIGEDIDLTLRITDRVLGVMADAGQMDQVLMNLVTNARDVMPEGGILAIATQVADLDEDFAKAHGLDKPGEYALLAVSDSGCGMDEATRAKIFEPFFTTKELGKGTGLGLSIVYGIVKQHKGCITAYSEPGKGTTFKIYLPILAAGPDKTPPLMVAPPCGGTETILLVEDDDNVRNLIKAILQDFGYQILEAVDGQAAIELYRDRHARIDLLIVDVIMPRKSGRDVYDAVRSVSPGVKVLFLSGYTADILGKKGIFDAGMEFLSKPVSPADLARKVRTMLDGKTGER